MTGQQVMLTPVCNELEITPFKDTVSVVDDEGNALMMVENTSEDILKIYGRTDILASVSFFRQNDEMSLWSIRMLENKRRLINYP